MKIESINDNQIRCTLSTDDLTGYGVRLSELAYGSAKARDLFQEVLTRANEQFGFSVDNMPLMVEAVPLSEGRLMIIITKVEDPEELDTRFSRFTQEPESSEDEDEPEDDDSEDSIHGNPDFKNIEHRLGRDIIDKRDAEAAAGGDPFILTSEEPDRKEHNRLTRIFSFDSLDSVCVLASQLGDDFSCSSTLYKSPHNNRFYLTVTENTEAQERDFTRACSLAAEFGRPERASANTIYYYDEHYRTLIAGNALQVLRMIG